MNEDRELAMAEATRLTRAGRLEQATTLIQTVLRRRPPEGETAHGAPASDRPIPDAHDGAGQGRSLNEVLRRLRQGAAGGATERPAPPVDPLPPGARFLEASFKCSAGSRSFRLYLPAGRGTGPAPLVVMLHGCTQDAADFAAGTSMNRHAERDGCLVLYPEQSRSANPGRCWNWFEREHQRAGTGEPSIIAGMVRQVIEQHRADPGQVFVAGLSAGGAMAAVMAASHPRLFRALGVHSGLAYEAASDMASAFQAMRDAGSAVRPIDAPVPTIVFHGDDDRTVHPANADRIVRQWRTAAAGTLDEVVSERGLTAGGRRYSRSRTLGPDGRVVIEQWRVHGAGHAWSGGSAAGSFTDPAGPDASAEMLRFFLEAGRWG